MSKKKIALIATGLYVAGNVVFAYKNGVLHRMKELYDYTKETGLQCPIGEYLIYILDGEERPTTWVKV